uniref:Uncharacterized protein n=1 Tax=viral metagenome TaxID=1070528 RepID=A0A6C0E3P1_9ZZZZ
MTTLISIFNNHFSEFLEDVQNVFPENVDIATAKNSLVAIRKTNPKLLINIWNTRVAIPYAKEIDEGNIDFFILKDYSQDLMKADNSDKIMESIDRLREPVKSMSKENQAKTMKYIQNLSKLSFTALGKG